MPIVPKAKYGRFRPRLYCGLHFLRAVQRADVTTTPDWGYNSAKVVYAFVTYFLLSVIPPPSIFLLLTGRRDANDPRARGLSGLSLRVSRHRDAVAIVNILPMVDWFGGGDQELSVGDDRAGGIGMGMFLFCFAGGDAFALPFRRTMI